MDLNIILLMFSALFILVAQLTKKKIYNLIAIFGLGALVPNALDTPIFVLGIILAILVLFFDAVGISLKEKEY